MVPQHSALLTFSQGNTGLNLTLRLGHSKDLFQNFPKLLQGAPITIESQHLEEKVCASSTEDP